MPSDQCAFVDVQVRDLDALRAATVTPLDRAHSEILVRIASAPRGDKDRVAGLREALDIVAALRVRRPYSS